MFIVTHKNTFFAISAMLVALSLFSIFFWGLNLSTEFTGGSITEVRFEGERPAASDVRAAFLRAADGETLIQPSGESNYIIRTRELTVGEHTAFLTELSEGGSRRVSEERYSLVGPSIGQELRNKAWIAIAIVILGISLFIAFAFRKTSEGTRGTRDDSRGDVSSWHYSVAALISLVHDVAIPVGVFSFLGSRFVDAQMDILFVSAILAVLGYSVHDTIVVFDRVRENLKKNRETGSRMFFPDIVGASLMQTMTRSINTSLTTLLALIALYFFGSDATKNFALVLAVGITAGTYSSIFLASPLLVAMSEWRLRRQNEI